MKYLKQLSCLIALSLWLIGCAQERTYLSNEIKEINPYQKGQILIFSSNHGLEDTLFVIDVADNRFTDGMGAPVNERMFVKVLLTDSDEERILKFYAKTEKELEQIDFSIALQSTGLLMKAISLDFYRSISQQKVVTSFANYDDVLIIENRPKRRISEDEIVEFWWSKSKGYVRLVQKNGAIWDLRSIE